MLLVEKSKSSQRVKFKPGEIIRQVVNSCVDLKPYHYERFSGKTLHLSERQLTHAADAGMMSVAIMQEVEPNLIFVKEEIDWARLETLGIKRALNSSRDDVHSLHNIGTLARIEFTKNMTLSFSRNGKLVRKIVKARTPSGLISASILNRMVVTGTIISFWADWNSIVQCKANEVPCGFVSNSRLIGGYIDRSVVYNSRLYCFEVGNSEIKGVYSNYVSIQDCNINASVFAEYALLQKTNIRHGTHKYKYVALTECTLYEPPSKIGMRASDPVRITFSDLHKCSIKESVLTNVNAVDSKLYKSDLSGATVKESSCKECSLHGSTIAGSELTECFGVGQDFFDETTSNCFFED